MPNCLWCETRAVVPISWETIFEMGPRPGFCEPCENELDRLRGKRLCKCCGRDLDQLSSDYQQEEVCNDCHTWMHTERVGVLKQNRSVFTYNPFLKDIMTRWKFRGDALLIHGMKREIQMTYRKVYKKKIVIPIPLSQEREMERTFNQSLMIAGCLKAPVVEALARIDQQQKQSKKSRNERLSQKEHDNPFVALTELKSLAAIQDKDVVLVDDIYTTGTTVRLAARALQKLNPRSISSFTLARS